jgi:hypothetical protein
MLQTDIKYQQHHSHSTSGTEHFITYAQWHRPTDPVMWGRGTYTLTIPQFVIGSFKLDSVPLPEGSILELEVTAITNTGGPQPVTYASIYAVAHINILNPCTLITAFHQ